MEIKENKDLRDALGIEAGKMIRENKEESSFMVPKTKIKLVLVLDGTSAAEARKKERSVVLYATEINEKQYLVCRK